MTSACARALIVAATLLLAVGCGARSGQRSAHDSDGSPVPPRDSGVRDNLLLDTPGPPLDMRRVDSCLPIPASQVQGTYAGKWTGTYRCPGQLSVTVNGELKFTLSPADTPDSFRVRGDMVGTVVSVGVPFATPIEGTMGCTALDAQLPRIAVGSGTEVFLGTGTLRGTFVASPRSFPNGSWRAQQSNSSCTASGTWSAFR
ncbi:MAG: hypothetical protein KC503_45190 [Myxococcales bacterium]|nr:hypothetical protein [Myxococcales bacterium]